MTNTSATEKAYHKVDVRLMFEFELEFVVDVMTDCEKFFALGTRYATVCCVTESVCRRPVCQPVAVGFSRFSVLGPEVTSASTYVSLLLSTSEDSCADKPLLYAETSSSVVSSSVLDTQRAFSNDIACRLVATTTTTTAPATTTTTTPPGGLQLFLLLILVL